MAITPYNLAAAPNVAAQGDEIIFTWQWDPTPQHETESIMGRRGYLFQRLDPNGNVVASTRTAASLTNPQIKQAFPGYSVDPYYWEYRVYATQWQWGGANGGSSEDEPLLGGPSNVVRVYDSGRSAADTAGRLEQFQNRDGTNIYPKTLTDGAFRQGDGRSLEEILTELAGSVPVIELPLSIQNGGTGAASAEIGLAALIDLALSSVPSTQYTNIYVPISIDGKCYKIPFTTVQKWTVGDRGNAANQANTSYSSFIARGIAAGTSDYTAGSTSMTSGTIYVVYE